MSLGRPIIDFFHLNRGERFGLIVLGAILVAVLGWHALLPELVSPESPDMSEYEPLIREFKARQAYIRDSLNQQIQSTKKTSTRKPSLTPFPFDPNNLPADQWRKMGLSKKQVQVIKNYEKKGGSFKNPEDLEKIYSLTRAEYEMLLPYIRIRKNSPGEKESVQSSEKRPSKNSIKVSRNTLSGFSDTSKNQTIEHFSEDFILSINSADTLDLQRLPGIGPVFSRRIDKYRKLLGGFFTAYQLLEVYGMDSVRFAAIQKHIYIDTLLIDKINVNQSPLKTLMRHPYIDFALAKMMLTERDQNGLFTSKKNLRKRMHLPNEMFFKISPYITFDQTIRTSPPDLRK